MKRAFFTIIIAVLLTVPSSFIQAIQPFQITSLRDVLSGPNCKRACWQNIEPGVTTLTELKLLWSKNNITPSAASGIGKFDENNAFYTWDIASQPPFVFRERKANLVSATTWNGTIIQMIAPLTPCVSEVIHTYGKPASISTRKEREEYSFNFLYPQEGLVFFVSTPFSSMPLKRFNGVFLVSERNFKNFLPAGAYETAEKWEDVVHFFSTACPTIEDF